MLTVERGPARRARELVCQALTRWHVVVWLPLWCFACREPERAPRHR